MDKDVLELQIDNFEKLCNKSKNLIFSGLIDQNLTLIGLLKNGGINDLIVKLSPIEQILFFALVIYKHKYPEFSIKFRIQKSIECNGHIYKADFCIEKLDIGNNNIDLDLTRPIIIECDGFEYHNSKEKMSYDYGRENELKLLGYDIIRFTGSQIYKNPEECVDTVFKYIKQIIQNGNIRR